MRSVKQKLLVGFAKSEANCDDEAGDDGEKDTPVPIPNTEVKLLSAENTWRATSREHRTLPAFSLQKSRFLICPFVTFKYSSIAQLVEHSAVNRRVVGSSPTGGATWSRGQEVKTPPFHGGNRGSIPLGITIDKFL